MSQHVVVDSNGNNINEARWASPSRPGISFRFRRWRVEPITSLEFPEEELVRYKGRFLRPKHFEDAVIDDGKSRS